MAQRNTKGTIVAKSSNKMEANMKLFVISLVAVILVGSLMVECTPKARVQDFEFMGK